MRIFSRVILLPDRIRTASRYLFKVKKELVVWLFESKERTNLTYHLENINKHHLAAFIAQITGKSYPEILQYINEIESDNELRNHIQYTTKAAADNFADLNVKYGRRVGWYAVVRAIKPKFVIETGVDKGMGACVLTAALAKNNEEGYKGYYYGTDINPNAGYLLKGKYTAFGKILFGDSVESLKKFDKTIDVFINDSSHSPDYEASEYNLIRDKLSEHAIILGDNAHVTDKLLEFAQETGRHFLFFQEKPYKHWHPGGGIGAAFGKE